MTHWTALSLSMLVVIAGCDATQTTTRGTAASGPIAARPEFSTGDESGATGLTRSSSPMSRITLPIDDGKTDGISVIRWQIQDNPSVITTFFAKHAPQCISEEVCAQLAVNGFLVAEVSLSDLPAALDELGGTYANIRAWLGQATTWHQLVSIPIRGSATAIVDGTTRRMCDGALQLLLRGWTVPLETGAVTDVEVIPAFLPGGAVPGARTTTRESFQTAGFFASIGRGGVLLITGMAPKSAKRTASHASAAGPPVTPPPTMGEFLLTQQNAEGDPIPQRPVIVVIPMIQSSNFFDSPFVESNSKPASP